MKITNVKKAFDHFSLEIPHLEIQAGCIYGLVGANGCGKSTLLKLIAGLMPKDSGEIEYGELTFRDITYLPRKPYLLHDTVYKNLVYPLGLRKIKPDPELVEYYLRLGGLYDLQKQYAPSLSNGEQQKLSMIRAMIFEPSLVLIDEGFSNLDIESKNQFEKLILEKQKKAPSRWILVSHQLSHIERLCQKVIFMDKGKILEEGTVKELLYKPQSKELAGFLQEEVIVLKNKRNEAE